MMDVDVDQVSTIEHDHSYMHGSKEEGKRDCHGRFRKPTPILVHHEHDHSYSSSIPSDDRELILSSDENDSDESESDDDGEDSCATEGSCIEENSWQGRHIVKLGILAAELDKGHDFLWHWGECGEQFTSCLEPAKHITFYFKEKGTGGGTGI